MNRTSSNQSNEFKTRIASESEVETETSIKSSHNSQVNSDNKDKEKDKDKDKEKDKDKDKEHHLSSSSPSPSPSSSSSSSASASSKAGKKHRTVRSLTRQYESESTPTSTSTPKDQNKSNSSNSSLKSFPSSSSNSSTSTSTSPSLSPSNSPTNSTLSPTPNHHHHNHHSRRPSVLLSTATYPSTLNTDPSNHIYRARTVSNSSIHSNHSDHTNSDKRLRTSSTASIKRNKDKESYLDSTTSSSPSPSPTMTGLPTLSISQEEDLTVEHAFKEAKSSEKSNGNGSGGEHHSQHDQRRTSSSSSSSAGSSSLKTAGIGSAVSPSINQNDGKGEEEAEDDGEGEGMDSIGELIPKSPRKGGSPTNKTNSTGSRDQTNPVTNQHTTGSSGRSMTESEKREHSRRHSRIHSRNLSVFFPRPGTEAELESDLERAKENFASSSHSSGPAHLSIDTTAISIEDRDGDRDRERRMENSSSNSNSSTSLEVPNDHSNPIGNISPTQSRRGHHHKHSVNFTSSASSPSHNNHNQSLLSPLMNNHLSNDQVLDQEDPFLKNEMNSPVGKLFSNNLDHSHSNHHHHHHHHQPPGSAHHISSNYTSAYSNSDTGPLSSIPYLSRIPSHLIPSLTFGILHFLLGSSLWVSGQRNDSLSVTGLGYLVVFDSFGILSQVAAGLNDNDATAGKVSQVRRPFGSHRISVLLHFTQSIYLLFSAVYVCKESVEHALLEGSDSEEHSHSIAHRESDGIILPWFLLLLATAFCLVGNLVWANHAKLVAACGIQTTSTSTPSHRGHGRQTSILTSSSSQLSGPFSNLLSNPFSLTVFFFCFTLLFASLTMPPFQASALDKVLAGMESAAMAYIAYPASKALGKVLLQTAPDLSESNQINGLKRAVKIIEDHPLVTFVAPPHVWQLTPPTSALTIPVRPNSFNNSLALGGGGNSTVSRGAKSASLITTLQIFIRSDSSDSDILDITRWAWERAAPSIGAGAGLKAGDNLRGSIMAGELVVQVEREGIKEEENSRNPILGHGHGHGHEYHHDHHHGHGHHHDHGHDHQHDHHHRESHSHDSSHQHHGPSSHSHQTPSNHHHHSNHHDHHHYEQVHSH